MLMISMFVVIMAKMLNCPPLKGAGTTEQNCPPLPSKGGQKTKLRIADTWTSKISKRR